MDVHGYSLVRFREPDEKEPGACGETDRMESSDYCKFAVRTERNNVVLQAADIAVASHRAAEIE
jgi:hypothetical protein